MLRGLIISEGGLVLLDVRTVQARNRHLKSTPFLHYN